MIFKRFVFIQCKIMARLFRLHVGKKNKRSSRNYVLTGLFFIISSLLIYLLDPLQIVAERMLAIQEGTYAFRLFKKPPLDVFINVYLWNVTNSAEFLAGNDTKLRFKEIGPYVYKEILENRNITFNSNGTMTYTPKRSTILMRNLSVGDPTNDIVIALNVPMLGLLTLASDLSFFAALAVSTLIKTTSSQPFLNLTVQDLLWGYDDTLITLASTVVPNIIPFKKFGLLDRMFDDGNNLVTIYLPEGIKEHSKEKKSSITSEANTYVSISSPNDLFTTDTNTYKPTIRDYSIDVWNGSPGLSHWGWNKDSINTACNTLKGNFDGTLFPRNISKNEVFKYYRKCFCRTLPIEFSHKGLLDGVEAYWFKLAHNAFENQLDDPDTSCYCKNRKCMKRGLGNITPCYWNIPAAVSLPHFYNSDPSLLTGVLGMNPDKEKHDSVIALQPKLGIPMKVNSRIQINLVMGSIYFNAKIEKLENIVLPIFWAEIQVDKLPTELIVLLKLLFSFLPLVQSGITLLLLLIGCSVLAYGALDLFSFFLESLTSHRISLNTHHNSNPRYSTVYRGIN